MRNLRNPRRTLHLVTLSIAFVLFAVLPGSLSAAEADSVGTLRLNGTFTIKFKQGACPAGTPRTTNCYDESGGGTISGLGVVSAAYILMFDDFGTACGRVHALIPMIVAGKGEIDLTTHSTGCITADALTRFPPSDITVSGGTGRYAGASGDGVLDYRNQEVGGGVGTHVITWTGTLNAAGVAFDTTSPQITGAQPKVVKTRAAAGTRVRYSVSGADATDGPVPVACRPISGSRFGVGRTSVTCTADDSSGNTSTTRFPITVKRVRR